MPSIGENLQNARRRVRLSQTTVAGELGTTRQGVAAFEKGERAPTLRHLTIMANLYRLTFDELVGGVRSVARATETPRFHARTNPDKEVSEDDREELASFDQYLQDRPGSQAALSLARRPFETIEQFADRWRTEGPGKPLGVRIPVPIFDLFAHHGIEVRFTALTSLAGALVPGDAGHPDGVLVNSNQPADRTRFTAGHELGHLAFAHEARGGCQTRLGRHFVSFEAQADQFASEILVPRTEISRIAEEARGFLRGRAKVRMGHEVYVMARRFLVSYAAMVVRLSQLGAVAASDVDRLKSEKPSVLARELGLDEREGSEAFDVGWLPQLVQRVMPKTWHLRADAEAVRLLQAVALTEYASRVSDGDRSNTPGEVYEAVALWVARTYPLTAR